MSEITKSLALLRGRLRKALDAPLERGLIAAAIVLSVFVLGVVAWREYGHVRIRKTVRGYEALAGVARDTPSATRPATAAAGEAKPQAESGHAGQVSPLPAATPKPNPVVAARVQRINDRKLFAPPQVPIQLVGVLGDEAIFNGGQAVKVGGTILNGTVTKINGDSVELLVEGRPQTLYVFEPPPVQSSGTGGLGGGFRGGGVSIAGSGVMPPSNQPGGGSGRGRGRGFGFRNREITPEDIERFKRMSPADRERILHRIEQRDPEAAQKIRQGL